MNMADLPHSHHEQTEPVSGDFMPHAANGSASCHTLHFTDGYSRFRGVQNVFLAAVVAAAFCAAVPRASASPAESAATSTATATRPRHKKTMLMVLESPTATAQQMAARVTTRIAAKKTSAQAAARRETQSSTRTQLRRNRQRNAQLTQFALPPAMPIVTTQPSSNAANVAHVATTPNVLHGTKLDAPQRAVAVSPLQAAQNGAALKRVSAGMGKVITVSSLKQLPPATQPLPTLYGNSRRASVIAIGLDLPSKTARAENSSSSNVRSSNVPVYSPSARPMSARSALGSRLLPNQLEVSEGTFVVLQTATDLDTVAIADPTIADVSVVNSRAVLVNGKKPGVTSLVIVDREKIRQYQVRVLPSPGTLPRDIAAQIGMPGVSVRQVRDAILLDGEVNSAEDARRAVEIAGIYSKKVVSQLSVRGVPIGDNAIGQQIQTLIGLPNVSVTLIGDALLLQGTVDSPLQRFRAEQVAMASGRKVTNLIDLPTLSMEDVQQTLGSAAAGTVGVDGTLPMGGIDPTSITVRRIGDQIILEGNALDQERVDQAIAVASRSGLQVISRLKVLPPIPAEARVLQAITTAIGIPGVTAYGSPKRLVLRGTVPDSNVANAAVQIARAYATEVDNMMVTPDPIQINVDVQIVEINTNNARNLGVQYGTVALTGETVTQPGTSLVVPPGSPAGTPAVPVTTGGGTTRTIDPTFQQGIGLLGNGFIGTGGLSNINPFRVRLNALYSTGNARLLSNPRTTVLSGRTATFQVGGQVPIPSGSTTNGSGTSTTIVFKNFGILLEVNPVGNNDGVVTMRVRTEVSQPDPTLGIVPPGGGGLIPGFSRRQTATEVVVGRGGTVALGGLIQNNITQTISRVPILSNIPILGALFRSKQFQRNQTELVIFVTPRVLPNTLPAGTTAFAGTSISDNTTNVGTQLGNPGLATFNDGSAIVAQSAGGGGGGAGAM
jgi:Flp pilus assembly secretin CpaC